MFDISKVDKNFDVPTTIKKTDVIWYDAANEPFEIYGACSKNPYRRVPDDIAETVNPGVAVNSRYTAGVRARFRCNSPYIAINVEWERRQSFSHMSSLGSSGFDLYTVDENGVHSFVKPFCPPMSFQLAKDGYQTFINTPKMMTDYVINFPSYNDVRRLYIGVAEGTEFEAAGKYRDIKPIVYYGSSITQGGCSSRPGTTYQNMLIRWLNVDYVNLGFSGSGRGESTIAEYMASLDMSVFVSDYDHNSTADELEKNHYALYRTIREKHPEAPYVMITRPDYNEDNREDVSRRQTVIASYERALAEGDSNVYFIDGAEFFAEGEKWEYTVDRLHPNDFGFYRMAEKIYPVLRKILG